MILVAGGTGFVGSHVVHAFRAAELPVRILARRPEKEQQLRAWGCELVPGDLTDPDSLRRAAEGCDTVVHLVAILLGSRDAFERIMVQGTRDLVEAAKEAGAKRLVLMSALGTEEGRELAPYYHAKWEEEQTVKYSGLEHAIFRPSFVFAGDGGILAQQIRIVRYSPVTPILGRHELQPIWADDVAAFFTKAVTAEEAANRTYDLGGADRLSWAELHALIRKTLGKRRLAFTMPPALLKAGASVGQILPPLRGARSAVEMLDYGDNVCDPRPAAEAFGIQPLGIEEQVRRAVAS
ncbi:MAG TPA: NAD(P)H-binding protein [Gaiellaceae bacterium]|nr:NAD(P)H-binding protein [Gaiellaceae bacterium]